VRENRTPGSVRGLPGNWQFYRAQLALNANDWHAQSLPKFAGASSVWRTRLQSLKRDGPHVKSNPIR